MALEIINIIDVKIGRGNLSLIIVSLDESFVENVLEWSKLDVGIFDIAIISLICRRWVAAPNSHFSVLDLIRKASIVVNHNVVRIVGFDKNRVDVEASNSWNRYSRGDVVEICVWS